MQTAKAEPTIFRRVWAHYHSANGTGRLARAVSWNILGGAASRLASLLGSFWVARALGKDGLGELGIVLSTFATVSVFASFGVGMTATRFISMLREADPGRAGRIATLAPLVAVSLAVIFSAALLLFTPFLSSAVLNAPQLAPYLRLAVPLLILGAFQESAQGILSGLEAFRALAQASALAGLLQAFGMISGAIQGGLAGCLIGCVSGTALGAVITGWVLAQQISRHRIPLGLEGGWREIQQLWRFALPAVLVGGVVMLANWWGGVLLMRSPNGSEQMGVFTAANQWRTAILYVPSLVATAGLPVLTTLWMGGGAEYVRVIQVKILIGLAASSIVAVPVMLASNLIFAGYGKAFVGDSAVLVLLSAAAILASTANMMGQSIVGEGRMWLGFRLNLAWATCLIVTAALLIPSSGALGLAWANLISFTAYVGMLGIDFYFTRRREQKRLSKRLPC
jgi:O-antigen/teichoic acid export membrane protein